MSPFFGRSYLSRVAERTIDMDLAACDIEVGPLQDEHLGGPQSNVCGEQNARAERRTIGSEQVERSVGEVTDLAPH